MKTVLRQTTGNASPSDVGSGDRVAPVGDVAHSQQSDQELGSKATPCVSEEETESDSILESKPSDLHPVENILGNVCVNSDQDFLSFAEVLYKCTLCTSLTSIMTSSETFVAHVTSEHLRTETRFECRQCDLKLGTDEDLRAHVDCAHYVKDPDDEEHSESGHSDSYLGSPTAERPPLPVTLAYPSTPCTPPLPMSTAYPSNPGTPLSPTTSAYPSNQGTPPLTTTPAYPSNPGTPPLPMTPAYPSNPGTPPVRMESPNPSKKDFPCNKYQIVKPSAPVVKINDLPKNENISKIQKLTEEIVQSQTPGTQANLMQSWSNMSSYTPEFGRYTKLVREGGNIVYFCQVCNWKCQVKAAFQAHCNGPHHNNKVRIGDQTNPHRQKGGSAAMSPSHSGGSPSHSMSPGLLAIAIKTDSDNRRIDSSVRVDGQFKLDVGNHLNGTSPDPGLSDRVIGQHIHPSLDRKPPNISEMPFLQELLSKQKSDTDFHGNFVFQKRSDKSENDQPNPGLSPEAYFEKSQRHHSTSTFTEHVNTNQENSVQRNKRKRPVPVSLRNQIESRTSWSDSDSDECAAARATNSDSSSNDGGCPAADKRYKHSELSPVQRDDFHSRMMRKSIAVSTQSERSSASSPAGSGGGHGEYVSPHLQDSFRNRLFASAFGASWGSMYGWFGQTNHPFQSPLYSSDSNAKDKVVADNPFENSIQHGSKLFPNAFTGFDYSGKHKQASEVLASRHDNQNSDTSDKDDNSRNSDTASENKTAIIKQESDEPVFRCSMCEYTCRDVHSYRHHFMAEHGVDAADNLLGDSQFSSMNEGWKMAKVRDCLPDLLLESSRGNVSRDQLLQKVSLLLGIPEVIHWGPACNKAVREVFQNSLAQRKGKYKKTYFFGVALLEQQQEQEDLSDSENVTYQPLRDMSQDLEKILEHLPELVCWTGKVESGVSRDELLELLAERITEKDVQHWGVQCNRAMRMLFPEVQMKRKGKYKTVFFGIEYSKNLQKQSFIPTKRGRPRKLNDDDDDDEAVSPVNQTCIDKSVLAWKSQMQNMKFFSQPRFQHHWRGKDGISMIPDYPARDVGTEISKDYNFLASELGNTFMPYHPTPFDHLHAYSATVQHKPEAEVEKEDNVVERSDMTNSSETISSQLVNEFIGK